jgi:parallel beta-helix repeat protein
MIKCYCNILSFLISFLLISSFVLALCPDDDTYINSNTILPGGFCEIHDNNERGVLILNSSDIVLDCNGTILKGNGSGFGINIPCYVNLKNITVKNCKAVNYTYGIELCTTRENKIFNNYLSNVSNVAIALVHNSSKNEIHDNVIEHAAIAGIRVYEGEDNRIYKNNITYSPDGILILNGSKGSIVDDSRGYCNGNTLSENFISECDNGIFYKGCKYGVISNNKITKSAKYGIFLNASKEENEIYGNDISLSNIADIQYNYEQYREKGELIAPTLWWIFLVIIIVIIGLVYYFLNK